MAELPIPLLRTLLSYDPQQGGIRWICAHAGRPVGDAGCLTSEGYIVITVLRRRKYAHRLAWALHYGEHPASRVDHIDGNKGNNQITNLRLVSVEENAWNQKKAQRNSTSGLLGAHYNAATGKWTSRIRHRTGRKFLGYFDTPEEAHEAYLRAKRELHTTCTI